MNMCKTIYLLVFATLFGGSLSAHPFKASVSEIRFNQNSGRFEITLKFFTDDLEDCIREDGGPVLYLETAKENSTAGSIIWEYISSGMEIRADGREVDLAYLGKEHEPGVTWCFIESRKINPPTTITIYNSLMTEIFPTQSNIVHVQVGRERKSLLLGTNRISGTLRFAD